jgi:N-acetylmuramoyl-L-alanine amidase
MPGAVWRPIPVSSSRPRRSKGRGVCLHVAVSEAPSLFDYFSSASADSHFYVAKNGTIEQYVDTDLVAYAQLDGNASLISVETQGGAVNPDGEPWTAAQVESLARIAAWAHGSEGVPLTPMPNSLPASRGIGYHRLGINPWRVAGGELWSSATGKLCPGAAKVAQVPQIITRASRIVNGEDMPLTNEDVEKIWAYPLITKSDPRGFGFGGRDRLAAVDYTTQVALQQLAGLQAAVNKLAGVVAAGGGVSADELRAVVREEMQRVVQVEISVRNNGQVPTG